MLSRKGCHEEGMRSWQPSPGGHSLLIPEQQQPLLTEHFQPFSETCHHSCVSGLKRVTLVIASPHSPHPATLIVDNLTFPPSSLLFPGLDFPDWGSYLSVAPTRALTNTQPASGRVWR